MTAINKNDVITLVTTNGGSLCLPPFVMADREDGGNLWVMPPRDVWERSELTRTELIDWSLLIAAAGRAMLDVLPQLKGGVINYWEAGNWGLNYYAEPKGQKIGSVHKKVHMHLIGRSPDAADPDWAWGEAPMFPEYADASDWMANKQPLTVDECTDIALVTKALLITQYEVEPTDITLPNISD